MPISRINACTGRTRQPNQHDNATRSRARDKSDVMNSRFARRKFRIGVHRIVTAEQYKTNGRKLPQTRGGDRPTRVPGEIAKTRNDRARLHGFFSRSFSLPAPSPGSHFGSRPSRRTRFLLVHTPNRLRPPRPRRSPAIGRFLPLTLRFPGPYNSIFSTFIAARPLHVSAKLRSTFLLPPPVSGRLLLIVQSGRVLLAVVFLEEKKLFARTGQYLSG